MAFFLCLSYNGATLCSFSVYDEKWEAEEQKRESEEQIRAEICFADT
jgi:hypothetical protein